MEHIPKKNITQDVRSWSCLE